MLVEPRVAMVVEPGEMMEPHIPAGAVVGVVAGNKIEQRTHGRFEDVAGAAGEDFQPAAVGPHADDAAAAERERSAVGALGVQAAEVTQGCIEPAVDAEFQSV